MQGWPDNSSARKKAIPQTLHLLNIGIISSLPCCRVYAVADEIPTPFGASSKQEIAAAIANRFPELAPRLPRFRKPWMSEDYRMSIFDAVALGLIYFKTK
jgi:hypothetical protein